MLYEIIQTRHILCPPVSLSVIKHLILYAVCLALLIFVKYLMVCNNSIKGEFLHLIVSMHSYLKKNLLFWNILSIEFQ